MIHILDVQKDTDSFRVAKMLSELSDHFSLFSSTQNGHLSSSMPPDMLYLNLWNSQIGNSGT